MANNRGVPWKMTRILSEIFGKMFSLRVPLSDGTGKMAKAGKYVGGKCYDQVLGKTQALQLQTSDSRAAF